MEKLLKNFNKGDLGEVVRVTGTGSIKRRIFDMGITPGTQIIMKKAAPLGDPIEISLRGYALTIRKSEAEMVLMNIE